MHLSSKIQADWQAVYSCLDPQVFYARAVAESTLRELEKAPDEHRPCLTRHCCALGNVLFNLVYPLANDARRFPELYWFMGNKLKGAANGVDEWNFPEPARKDDLILDRLDDLTMRVDRLIQKRNRKIVSMKEAA